MENYAEINYKKNMEMLERAYSFFGFSGNHDEVMSILAGNDELHKQLLLIELAGIFSQAEADILVFNLTEKSGPVRETCAFKILELIADEKYRKFFQTEKISDIFVKAVTDINPSVARNAVRIINYTDNSSYLYNKFISEINKTLSSVDFSDNSRSFEANRKNFNLYRNLEAISNLVSKHTPGGELEEILKITANCKDYTIREKTAILLTVLPKTPDWANSVKDILKNDENIYVRMHLVI